MKTFLLLMIFSVPSFSQIEKPLLEGVCRRDKVSVNILITADILKAAIKKSATLKNCDFEFVNSSSTNRLPIEKETLYFVPSACDGRLVSESGYRQGSIIGRGFLTISKTGSIYQGVLSILSDEDPLICEVKVRSWKKLEELSQKKRKLN